MSIFLFSNNANTTLAGPVAANSVTLNVAGGAGSFFPNPGVGQYFGVTLVSATDENVREIAYCTARSGDTLTVTRGQEGTAPTAFNAGDLVSNDLTAAMCASFLQILPTPTPPTPTPTPPPTPTQAYLNYYGVDFGPVNNIQVTLNPQQPGSLALLAGSPVRILIANTNTGNTVLTINGLPTTTVFALGGPTFSLPAGSIVAGQIFEFFYTPGVGFAVSTAKVLLAIANTWAATQTIANGLAWSGSNTSGASQRLIGVDSNNQTATYAGPSGTSAWRIVNGSGSATLVAVDTAGGVNVVNLNVTNAASVQNGLTVTGGIRVNGGVNVITGGINVTGDSTIQNKLTVAGAASLNSTLQVGGTANVNQSLGVGGGLNVAGSLGVTGGAIFQSTVGITGTVNMSSQLTAQGNVNFQNSMSVIGGVNIHSTLGVTGGANFSSTLGVIGSIICQSPIGATAFNVLSDYRIKITYGMADVGALIDKVPVYDAKFINGDGHRRPMFLAHELAKAAPHAVYGAKDAVNDDGTLALQGVDQQSFVPALWAELQDLRRRIAELEKSRGEPCQ